jgi:hypothetical protein
MIKIHAAEKDRPMPRSKARAWRLMGAAFERLLRSEPADRPERLQAVALAEWLHLNSLTADERGQFMVNTGWVFSSDELAPLPLAPSPPVGADDPELHDDEIPF